MATPTYIPLATQTLSSTATSVTFSSIPATYRDLVLVLGSFQLPAATNIWCRVNGDGSSSYSYVYAFGTSSAATSSTNGFLIGGLAQGASMNTIITQFMDYSATDKHKTVLSRPTEDLQQAAMIAGRWPQNTAINSLTIRVVANSMAIGSTLSLYGIE
jgi:hypothetical protein